MKKLKKVDREQYIKNTFYNLKKLIRKTTKYRTYYRRFHKDKIKNIKLYFIEKENTKYENCIFNSREEYGNFQRLYNVWTSTTKDFVVYFNIYYKRRKKSQLTTTYLYRTSKKNYFNNKKTAEKYSHLGIFKIKK